WGCAITAADVMLVLLLQNRGFRYIEAVVIVLILTIGTCFGIELFLAKPAAGAVIAGFVPSAEILKNPAMLYVAIGILGATVMPHNLYLRAFGGPRRRRSLRHRHGVGVEREAVVLDRLSA
ncbi:MAG TPA: divalent metal cation transporter, partial [Magnetospirillum sp.]|nr:divalent metal cation transporter [Magnetospirillum sp.]